MKLDPKKMLPLFVDPTDIAPYQRVDAYENAEDAQLNSSSSVLAQYKFEKFVEVKVAKTVKVVDAKL